MLVNDQGKTISGIPGFARPEYKTDNGDPDWDKYLIDADNRGFYRCHKYDNGRYTRETVLPIGTILVRYGDIGGRFLTDKNTPYKKLSLPYIRETVEFHRYIVIVPLLVEEGLIALGFDNQEGYQATQYFTSERIVDLLGTYLKEDFSWKEELKWQKK